MYWWCTSIGGGGAFKCFGGEGVGDNPLDRYDFQNKIDTWGNEGGEINAKFNSHAVGWNESTVFGAILFIRTQASQKP